MTEDTRTQRQKFEDRARELETDDDEARFDEKMRKLMTHKSEAQDNMAKGRKGG